MVCTLIDRYASSQWSKCCGLTRRSDLYFTVISKITKEIWQDLTDSDLKVHALHQHCANELLVHVRLSCQKLFQTRSTWRNNAKKKNVREKSNDEYSFSIRVYLITQVYMITHQWHTRLSPRVPLFCSYHILTSSVIYYWTDARSMESIC